MKFLFAGALALALVTHAQTPCDAKCNQEASECMKRCAGDSKDAAKPEQSKRLMACLQTCDAQTKPCREACRK